MISLILIIIKENKTKSYLSRESTEERIPEMTQCEGKVLVEEILEEFTHA